MKFAIYSNISDLPANSNDFAFSKAQLKMITCRVNIHVCRTVFGKNKLTVSFLEAWKVLAIFSLYLPP